MQYLTFQDLNEQETNEPIWVVNRSAENVKHKGGADIFLAIYRGANSNPDQIRIDRTWLPINLTDRCPRKYVLDSSHFMDAVNKELIGIISSEDARKILSRPQAKAEQLRLSQIKDVVSAAGQAKTITQNKNVTITSGDDDEEKADKSATQIALTPVSLDDEGDSQPVKASAKKRFSISMADDNEEESAPEEDTLSASFRAWANKLNTLTEDQSKNEIELRGSFEIDEIKYIVENVSHAKIKATMEKQLAALS